jgi:hypothetical protein
MSRTILFFALLLASCNNNSDSSANKNDSSASSKTKTVAAWSKEDENNFLHECIESSKGKYGEDTAYRLCNCALKQVEQKYPSADSAASVDSMEAMGYLKNCK